MDTDTMVICLIVAVAVVAIMVVIGETGSTPIYRKRK